MNFPSRPILRLPTIGAACFIMFAASPSQSPAYIDAGGSSITLPELCLEFHKIAVLRVEKIDAERGAVRFQVADTLQGRFGTEAVQHSLRIDGRVPDGVRQMRPGDRVVFFSDCHDKRSVTLASWGWYLTANGPDGWEHGAQRRADLEAVFCGTVSDLADAIRRLRRGEPVVVPFRPGAPKEKAEYHVRYEPDAPHHRLPALAPQATPADYPLDKWADRLKSDDPTVRYQAAIALGLSGASAFTPDLRRLLEDRNPQVRLAATTALGTLRTDAAASVPALAALLRDRDRFVNTAAARALRRFGAEAKPALQRLGETLEKNLGGFDYRALRQGEIAETILVIDPTSAEARRALRLLTNLLNDDRPDSNGTRLAGARALGRCGSAAQAAVPALVQRLRDKELAVRVAAAEALLLIAGTRSESAQAVEVLSDGLSAAKARDRRETVRAVDRLGPLGRALLPALRKLRDDPDAQVREAAQTAIARVEAK